MNRPKTVCISKKPLIAVFDDVRKLMDKKQVVILVKIDFSRAYDDIRRVVLVTTVTQLCVFISHIRSSDS